MSDYHISPNHLEQKTQKQETLEIQSNFRQPFYERSFSFSQKKQAQSNHEQEPQLPDNNRIFNFSPENNSVRLDTYEHKTALQIIMKLVERNYSRFFIRGLTFAYIQSLKDEQKKSREQIKQMQNRSFMAPSISAQETNWPFKELYLLEYRTPEQQQLFEFVNLCATMIQSNFKRYITQKRHKKALKKTKRAHQLISALVKGWKAYRVYNSKKCFEIRNQIRGTQKQIDLQQQNWTHRDAKKIKMLYKYVEVHSKLFQQTFSIYMETGAWVFDENMKPKIHRRYTKPKVIPAIQQSRTRFSAQPQFIVDHFEKQKENFNRSNMQTINYDSGQGRPITVYAPENQSNTPAEERPICAKGAYVFDEQAIQIPKQPKREERKQQKFDEQIEETQKQRLRREQKQKQKKKMQKRQKYDPRKAIIQEKKRKLQKQKVQGQQNTITEVTKKVEKCYTEQNQKSDSVKKDKQKSPKSASKRVNQKKQIKIKANKPTADHKKVKSRVDCWANEKEPEPQWVKEYKSRMILQQNKIQVQSSMNSKEQKNNANSNFEKNIMTLDQQHDEKKRSQENPRFEYSWQKKQIQQLKNHHENMPRQNSTHQLREQLKAIHQRNMASKNNFHRNVIQLEEAYGSAYTQRYQRLLPKLQLLSYARGVQKQSKIPVIDEESQQLYNQFGYIEKSSGHFWALCSNHQKVFRGFIERDLNI